MRKYRNVSPLVQANLESSFPKINNIRHEDNAVLNQWAAISFFDHWLTEDQHHLIDNISNNEHFKRRNNYFNFIEKLVASHEVFTFRMKGRPWNKKRIQFKSFTNNSNAVEYLKSANYAYSRNAYPVVLIPSCEAVLYEQYDYTSVLCFRDLNKVSSILESAESCNLHIIRGKKTNVDN